MTQHSLADLTDLSHVTIIKFEREKKWPGRDKLITIRAVLEVEGVMFLDQDEYGPGVRLRDRV